ncbi:hypothetical protein GSI_15114 [Ganoderma sinense ZZ0214-1]|uniref:Uncharacterized protein n=1 Tax=Ganoderma sinense ZZ0214-1 TaxID=1077348 RepID=A0A2G8RLN1_9APHY|nr:hypothetical protein GSI_15114 [Ganoderma sinense ZZ0214-1]
MSAFGPSQPLDIPPVHRLPPELLIDILVHCSDEPSDQLNPIVFGRVCRYWKDVSCLSPRIWQHVYLFESNGTTLSHDQALCWMERSVPLPFDVRIEAATPDMILPLLSPVLSNMQRLRRCVISGRHEEEFDFDKYAFDRTRGCLIDELHLLIKGVSALDTLGINTDGASDVADDRTYSTVFRVHGPADGPQELALHFSVYALPLESVMKPIPVTSVCITEFSLEVSTDVARMVNFLRCTPLLETLHFTGWPQEGEPIQPGVLVPVLLTRLRTLLVRSTVSVRAILEHIDAPALEELFLEHTNVDFELRTEPYVALRAPPYEGESDDEAHDFSQSPWSDHATGTHIALPALSPNAFIHALPFPCLCTRFRTPIRIRIRTRMVTYIRPIRPPTPAWTRVRTGMGLRTLLRRSRPPLRLLHMDYADMRTKDFWWCFEHLPYLREFRIVGSDMSDRVVAMLAPYQRRRMAYGLANAYEDDARGSWAVRLPSLQKLAVWHCQRVTGDAVVQAFRERVRFTDRAAAEGRGETLESVAVVGCSEFLFQHGQALAETLGDRLRVS